ncbi:hypothetical protein FHS92_000828 [Sphingobium subterraneum]|uniref:PilZ domain-containing protein n=2 Tax=Sphingobium subterraneum TaxID=627688 RepID=A0A841J4E4_9SPHN|nr:hypothetical protein [Sphingobium subterraneum]
MADLYDDKGNPLSSRKAPRDSLLLMTTLHSSDGRDHGPARVRNLSATGLMMECRSKLPIGAPVSLNLRGIGQVTGTVRRCDGARIGVAFDEKINPQLARKTVGVAEKPITKQYLRSPYRN